MNGPRRVSEEEYEKVAEILTEAFFEDPMIKYVFKDRERKEIRRLYGVMTKAYAPSSDIYFDSEEPNGMIQWIDSEKEPGVMAWLRSGAMRMIGSPISSLFRLMKTGMEIFKTQKECMKGHNLHLILLAVLPRKQGMGIGKKLMNLFIQEADSRGLPCYLETQNPSNLRFYESFGFSVVKEIEISPELRSWSMVRPIPLQEHENR
ncbi:GNAT family N-acetyltransferase [Mesotoga prima]|uniref:GNAT family N-acetyltransferase n=1 Tax=Mesotoga prima TaxID=1184387 RepID=UPI002FDAC457